MSYSANFHPRRSGGIWGGFFISGDYTLRPVAVRLPRQLFEDLYAAASAKGMSLSAFVRFQLINSTPTTLTSNKK